MASTISGTPGGPSIAQSSRRFSTVSGSSWKTSNVRHIAQQVVQPPIQQPSSLVHAYMVCGLNRDPTEWLAAPKPRSGRVQRKPGSIGKPLCPQILCSIPPHDSDEETAQLFAAALKAAFPNDCEICVSHTPPGSTSHSFVLQLDAQRSLYGVALRLWVKSDAQRMSKIAQVLETSELDHLSPDVSVWVSYCLSYISRYPLYDLMADYLRCSWMLWSKQPDTFNSNGVLRLMRTPPPRPNQIIRIALDKYTLCYRVPSNAQDFQNFALWPLFTCLSSNHIIAILEAALSGRGQIIFISQHTAILTAVTESIRYYLKSWAGLYVPIVYGRHAQELVDESAPYILGITKQSRSLFTPPKDALLIDLDADRVFTSSPPGCLSPRQRTKYARLLSEALYNLEPTGVPAHFRSAYEQNVRFSAFGEALSQDSALSVEEPLWWNHHQVQAVMQYICDRARRNFKLLNLWKSIAPANKVSTQDLTGIVHHRNQLARNLEEAWRECINTKSRSDLRETAAKQREASLNSDLRKSKQEFKELGECTEQLIEETRQLQAMIKEQNQNMTDMSDQLNQKTGQAKQMSSHISELQKELDHTNQTLKTQQELLDELRRARSDHTLSQERDAAQRAVIHLTSLISGQVAHIERVMGSLLVQSRPSSSQDNLRKDATKRRSLQRSPSPQVLSPVLFQRHVPSPTPSNEFLNRRLGQLVYETDSFDDKVRVVTETVRKINNQCYATIEDLGVRRSSQVSVVTDSDRATMWSLPDLDSSSRAETRQSESVGSFNDVNEVDEEGSVRIKAIDEEVQSELGNDHFVDAAVSVNKQEDINGLKIVDMSKSSQPRVVEIY